MIELTNTLGEPCEAQWNRDRFEAHVRPCIRIHITLGRIRQKNDKRWEWWLCNETRFFNFYGPPPKVQGVARTEAEAKAIVEGVWRGPPPVSPEEELAGLKKAIKDAGFGIMKCANGWSIHDVSEKAKADEERTADIIADNIDLELKVKRLEDEIKGLHEVVTAYKLGYNVAH